MSFGGKLSLTHPDDTHTQLLGQIRQMLRAGVEAQRSGETDGDGVVPAVRQISRLARERRVPVEQVLILCKEAWLTLPDAQLLMPSSREETIGHLITLCIDAYYAGSDGDGKGEKLTRGE